MQRSRARSGEGRRYFPDHGKEDDDPAGDEERLQPGETGRKPVKAGGRFSGSSMFLPVLSPVPLRCGRRGGWRGKVVGPVFYGQVSSRMTFMPERYFAGTLSALLVMQTTPFRSV